MAYYKIAGLIVEMNPKGKTLLSQGQDYLISEKVEKPDIKISFSEDFLKERHELNPHLTQNDCEYLWYGFDFYRKLLDYDGYMLHSSAISLDNKAYLFSAPSGTGKSTHTSLWKKHFGSALTFINDDKPAVRNINGSLYACGTPFSGKTDNNNNIIVPLKAICILKRGEKNKIRLIKSDEAQLPILNQCFRPCEKERMIKLLDLLNATFAKIPIYLLECNISDEAVITAYNAMSK